MEKCLKNLGSVAPIINGTTLITYLVPGSIDI